MELACLESLYEHHLTDFSKVSYLVRLDFCIELTFWCSWRGFGSPSPNYSPLDIVAIFTVFTVVTRSVTATDSFIRVSCRGGPKPKLVTITAAFVQTHCQIFRMFFNKGTLATCDLSLLDYFPADCANGTLSRPNRSDNMRVRNIFWTRIHGDWEIAPHSFRRWTSHCHGRKY